MALPTFGTPIVGRDIELALVRAALADSRCVTIFGASGIGKTRLAIEAARQAEAPLGVRAVLATVDVLSGNLPSALAAALDLRATESQDVRGAVIASLKTTALLLLLDGFDNDAEGAWLGELLASCDQVRILATSLCPLNVPGERLIKLNPIAADDPAAEAIFINAARTVQPSFAPDAETRDQIRALCALCEGMPLALELAAYWVPLVPVRFIVSQLTHDIEWLTDARHLTHDVSPRSLQASFRQFWNRLSENEQVGLARLSIFEGGFDAEAARALAEVSDAFFARLADGFFLRPVSEGRFALHALMRRYLLTRLPEIERDLPAFEARFAQLMLAQARGWRSLRTTAHYPELLRRLTDDYANMRAALGFAVRAKDAVLALRLFSEFATFWISTGRTFEMRALCERAMALDRDDLPPDVRAAAHATYGNMLETLGDFARAQHALELALELSERHTLAVTKPLAASGLAGVEMRLGHFDASLQHAQQAIAGALVTHDMHTLALGHRNAGVALYDVGRLPEARAHLDEALVHARAADDPTLLAGVHNDRGISKRIAGDRAGARYELHEALRLNRLCVNNRFAAINLVNLASIAHEMEEYNSAIAYVSESLSLAEQLGAASLAAHAHGMLGHSLAARGELDAAQTQLRTGLRKALACNSPRTVANGLLAVCGLMKLTGKTAQAAALGGLLQSHPRLPGDTRAESIALLEKLKPSLAPERFDALVALGATMDLEAVARRYADSGEIDVDLEP